METPFTEYTGPGTDTEYSYPIPFALESPFRDDNETEPDSLVKDETISRDFGFVLTENQVPVLQTSKIGDAVLPVAGASLAQSAEYLEPAPSGNPLFSLQAKDRQVQLSNHFKAGEFAQSQWGKYKFDYFRLDPQLLTNLQWLRNFTGKPVEIIDGYYTTRYLKEILGITDPEKIRRNPHITGRAVKLSIKGYQGMMKQIALAAVVACNRDVNIGIGTSTITLAVKQMLHQPSDQVPEDFQRIVSYIKDEKLKVDTYTFCVDVKRLIYDHAGAWHKSMHQALSAFVVTMMKFHFSQPVPEEWTDWETPIGDVVSIMHEKSITKHPNVILYGIAYSPFGFLYRNYLKNRNKGTAEKWVIEDLITASGNPSSFIASSTRADKTYFIETCRNRILLGKKYDGSAFHLAPQTFFDWVNDKEDKNFMAKINQLIKDVYIRNRYAYDVPPQQSPVGGTKRNPLKSAPAPDKPVVNFTGRYWAQNRDPKSEILGIYLLINQAGNYISGKGGEIRKTDPVTDLRKTVKDFFYGKVDEKGNGICNLEPQQTIILKKAGNRLMYHLVDNKTDSEVFQAVFVTRYRGGVISKQVVDSFQKINPRLRDLVVTLAWVYPPPEMLKTFFESFKTTESEVKKAIAGYYDVEEAQPTAKRLKLAPHVTDLDTAINNYLKLPPMFSQFSNYYIRFYYSVLQHWRPRGDIEERSVLDWIVLMLQDYRDLRGTTYIESNHKRLYDYFGVDTKIPDIHYHYKLSIKLTAFGIGPFARSSGEITIENKTDFLKYPNVEKWDSVKYPIVLWNATLSLNPLSWRPKISSGQTIEAEIDTDAFYSAGNFSGADIQVTEGKLFEIPVSGRSGGVKVSTKIGMGGVVILIDGKGKKTLEFKADTDLGLPDTIEIEPSVDSEPEGTFEKIAGFLPSLTMYRGWIDTKDTSKDLSKVPLADRFTADYLIKDTRYFMHDNAELTAQGIEAIGRLCAEELATLLNPASKIEIYGHADASGDEKYNKDLSLTRAINVQQAIIDRFGGKVNAAFLKVEGLGESEANRIYGQFTEKNAWLRKVVVLINGRAVLSLGEL